MKSDDLTELLSDVRSALVAGRQRFAILGHTPIAYEVEAKLRSWGAEDRSLGIYDVAGGAGICDLPQLREDSPDVVVVASDHDKEHLLEAATPFLAPDTTVVLAGYGHFEYQDEVFEEVTSSAVIPSLANGYPHTLTHLYQCLSNAARLELVGVVAEFGMFKGGTTLMLASFVRRLGMEWPIIGFDTFDGFPPKRSVLDMYAHPGCVFRDEAFVRRAVEGAGVEVVSGDILQTVSRLENEDVVLAFIDMDNYTPAVAVLDAIQDRVVVGGAIVFDHVTGRRRFRYTLGERMAARRLLDDRRYFHLHDTGVFLRQC